jgi:hypothetical protein
LLHNMIAEPTPFCSERMTMDDLIERRTFLEHSLQMYYRSADQMDRSGLCPIDPCKFRKLKAYNEKRLAETNRFIFAYLNVEPIQHDLNETS